MTKAARTQIGTVQVWWRDRGFGFLTPDARPTESVFTHLTNVSPRRHLSPGERVMFTMGIDEFSGRHQALVVEPIEKD